MTAERIERLSIPEPNSGCWLWLGALDDVGRARMSWRGRNASAARISWEIANGRSPGGLCVCHRCDMPACVNPDHLFLGTHADNMADMARKGRANMSGCEEGRLLGPLHVPKGEACHLSKLTAADVLAIRAATRSIQEIAQQFGISANHAYGIRKRRYWRHL